MEKSAFPYQRALERNLDRFKFINLCDGLWLLLPIYIPFLLDRGITLAQVGLLLGAQSAMQFIFELPSSVWADRYSRRGIMLLNGCFILLSDALFLGLQSFPFFLLACLLAGLGNAFNSGTFSALIYDTLLGLGRATEYDEVQAGVNKSYFLGGLLAALLGAGIYVAAPDWLFPLVTAVHLAYIAAVWSLSEPARAKSASRSLAQVREGFAFLRREPVVWRLLLIYSLVTATLSFAFVYYTPALRALQVPTAWFGPVFVLVNVANWAGAHGYLWLKRRADWKSFLLLFLGIDLVSSLLLGSNLMGVLLATVLISLAYGAQNIYVGNIIHSVVPSSHRATALSLQAQADRVFYGLLVAGLGYVATGAGFRWALLLNALLVLLALGAFLALTRGRRYLCEESAA